MHPFWLPTIACLCLCFACKSPDPGPERAATRRLTTEEYQNTVWDLLEVAVPAAMLPADELIAGFPNNVASSIGGFDAENYLGAAEYVGAQAVLDVEAVLGCTEASRACAGQWAPSFLARAYRRPVEAAETERLLELYDVGETHADGVRLMVTGTLMTGSFLYRPELRGVHLGDRVQLDDYEIASRLSYLLWRSMPDAALFDAAADGALSTPEEVADQARRMLHDPRAGAGLSSFHLDWLGLANAERLERVLPTPEAVRIPLLDQLRRDWDIEGTFVVGELAGEPAWFVEDDGPAVAYHGLELGPEFKLKGRMMAEHDDGEVGLTVLTTGSTDERDFHFRRLPGGRFEVRGAECVDFTQFHADPEEWIEFEISGVLRNMDTTLEIRLWHAGDAPPANRDLLCKSPSTRRGTVALWADGPGTKGWEGLLLQTVPYADDFDFRPIVAAYLQETRAFVSEWANQGGSYQELLAAQWTMANEQIAGVYGIEGVTGADLRVTPLPAERAGILTQPLFLSTWAKPNQSSPVMRGVAVRQALLCDVLAPPPPDVMVVAPDPSPDVTTRERFAIHSENDACAGCHALTDPVGFGFETFDQFGQYRTTESGQPIDSTGEIVSTGGLEGSFDDVRGLVDLLSDSDDVRDCIVRNWYRYTRARLEGWETLDPALEEALRRCDDADCVVEDIVTALVEGDSFRFRAAHDGDAP